MTFHVKYALVRIYYFIAPSGLYNQTGTTDFFCLFPTHQLKAIGENGISYKYSRNLSSLIEGKNVFYYLRVIGRNFKNKISVGVKRDLMSYSRALAIKLLL